MTFLPFVAGAGLLIMEADQPPGLLRGALFAVLLISTGFVLYQRIRLRMKLTGMAAELQRAVHGNLNTRILTGHDRLLDEVIFSINELIEQMEKVQVQTIRSEAARKSLLSNISHDIRTPLTSMIGYVDALKDDVAATVEERRDYLEIISRKAGGLKELIDEIFLMAKLDADEIPMKAERLDLAESVRESVIEFWPEMSKLGIELSARIPDEPCPVKADRLSLQRIMGNIIKNALYYGQDGKVLGIDLIENTKEYQLHIWDRGAGIAEGDLPRIFERMYRTDRSRNLLSGGSGLGLAIARSLVEKNGGSIWAESVPGEKTTVAFSIPKA